MESLPGLVLAGIGSFLFPGLEAVEEGAWNQERVEREAALIRRDIEELRGKRFRTAVEIRLTDREGFAEAHRRRLERSLPPEDLAADEMAAKLLGMIPGDADLLDITMELYRAQSGGFYDPSSDTFYMLEGFAGGVARLVMARELAHALDDQYFDIDGTESVLRESTDAMLAHHAVVEGSGQSVMTRWMLRNLDELDLNEILTAQATLGPDAGGEVPPFVWKPLLAANTRGESFLRRTNVLSLVTGSARVQDIDHAFAEVPRSTEQILHPVKYWKERRVDEPRAIDCDTSRLPAGWTVLSVDTLGELYFGIMTLPFEERSGLEATTPFELMTLDYTNDAAQGWGGDRMVLASRDGGYLLRLVSRWDTPADAREFHAALCDLAPQVRDGLGTIDGFEGAAHGFEIELGESDEVRVASWVGLERDVVAEALVALECCE